MVLSANQVAKRGRRRGVDVKAVSSAAAGLRKSQEERSNVRGRGVRTVDTRHRYSNHIREFHSLRASLRLRSETTRGVASGSFRVSVTKY